MTEYPSIEQLTDPGKRYLLSQKAMARYLRVTKQTISKALQFPAFGSMGYRIIKKPTITKTGKQKLVPIRFYELDSFYYVSLNICSRNSGRVVETLKNHNLRYEIANAIINQETQQLICLD